MPKLSCIGYCRTYDIECKFSAGIDRDGLVHCQTEHCPMEVANNGTT
jgi:hypothetical protein